MRKTVGIMFAVGVAATLLVPRAVGNEAEKSVLKQAGNDRTLADYLPKPNGNVPWLDLDPRTKLPKGDYPLGRGVQAAPALLPGIPHADLTKFALGGL